MSRYLCEAAVNLSISISAVVFFTKMDLPLCFVIVDSVTGNRYNNEY